MFTCFCFRKEDAERTGTWIICFRGQVTEVRRELKLDTGETWTLESVLALKLWCCFKKGHSHHNLIRSLCRYFRWLASFLPSISLILYKPPHSSGIKGNCQRLFVQTGRQIRAGRLTWGMLFEDGLKSASRGCMEAGGCLWGADNSHGNVFSRYV